MEKKIKDKTNPREIPVRQDPGGSKPEKDPKIIPNVNPSRNNPRNPKEDLGKLK